ncbi:MAG: DUF6754 domain-containing protein [Chloroflexota bacterium]|nr:DUF6754 domain-containing protein [Chloroflexota bacterium]
MHVGAITLLTISALVLVVLLILRGRRGPRPTIRPLPAFQELRDETGRAAECGGVIHIALGNGGLSGEDAISSLAGLQMVEALASDAISYSIQPIITVGDPTLFSLAQDTLRRAYERHGLTERYNPGQVRFIAPSPVAYAAGTANVVAAEDVTVNVMVGAFGAEVSLIADAGARRALPQLAAVAAPRAVGALYPVTDNLAVGEELYATGAYVTGERRYLAGLVAQDILRVILVLAILGVAAMTLVGG